MIKVVPHMNALERGFDSRRESCGEAGVETAMIRLLVGTLLLLFVSNITAYWRNLPGNYRTYRGLRVSSSIGKTVHITFLFTCSTYLFTN